MTNLPNAMPKMDKTHFSVVSLNDASDEKEYWLSKKPSERLQALELLRQINYGYNPFTTRLQRIISVSHLKANKKASGRHKDLNDLENLP